MLRTENEIGFLVEEIHGWLSEKSRVIAVVSAIGKTTDRLINLAVRYGENFNLEGAATLASKEAVAIDIWDQQSGQSTRTFHRVRSSEDIAKIENQVKKEDERWRATGGCALQVPLEQRRPCA